MIVVRMTGICATCKANGKIATAMLLSIPAGDGWYTWIACDECDMANPMPVFPGQETLIPLPVFTGEAPIEDKLFAEGWT